jgi:hypothetical protein
MKRVWRGFCQSPKFLRVIVVLELGVFLLGFTRLPLVVLLILANLAWIVPICIYDEDSYPWK